MKLCTNTVFAPVLNYNASSVVLCLAKFKRKLGTLKCIGVNFNSARTTKKPQHLK